MIIRTLSLSWVIVLYFTSSSPWKKIGECSYSSFVSNCDNVSPLYQLCLQELYWEGVLPKQNINYLKYNASKFGSSPKLSTKLKSKQQSNVLRKNISWEVYNQHRISNSPSVWNGKIHSYTIPQIHTWGFKHKYIVSS